MKILPRIDRYSDGTEYLVMPLDVHRKYRWWQKGQSIVETLRELGASSTLMAKHADEEGGLPKETIHPKDPDDMEYWETKHRY